MEENVTGLCECGCGQKTRVSKHGDKRRGVLPGRHYRFIQSHTSRSKDGRKFIDSDGYVLEKNGSHHRRNSTGWVKEHILLAEKALGKALPQKAVVHHVNGDRSDNSNANLVVCNDQSYHMLLHMRAESLMRCGNANWRKCKYCKKYDDPKNLYLNGSSAEHRNCHAEYERGLRIRRKNANG